MEEQEDPRDRTLRALQVAAVSGFVKRIRELQRSCLGLCNACRDGVPIPLLKVDPHAPSSFLRSFSLSIHKTEADPVSRVVPHRRVLSVELRFPDCGIFFNDRTRRQQEEDRWCSGEMVDINKVTWPEGTINIILFSLNQPIPGVIWPESLERLMFGQTPYSSSHYGYRGSEIFDQSLDGVRFPSGLRELYLGEGFNQPIQNVAWPEGMENLSLPGFNRPIDKVCWPAGLKVLEFMPSLQVAEMKNRNEFELQLTFSFNQPIDTGLPAGLHTLWLSNGFNQPIDAVTWPTGLVNIGFGAEFRQSLNGIIWPSTLRKVFFMERPVDFEDGELPPGCIALFPREPDSDSDAEGSYQAGWWEDDGGYGWSDDCYGPYDRGCPYFFH